MPSDGAIDVDIPDVAQIVVSFNEAMDDRSITANSFVFMDASGAPVPGVVRYQGNPGSGVFVQNAAIFTPAQPLARSSQYHFVLTTAIKDFSGNPLAADFNASFATITDAPWRPTSVQAATPSSVWRHSAVWTGSEMIVYGGFVGSNGTGVGTNTGARYNPATDSWTAMSPGFGSGDVNALWTGTEMLTWVGGVGGRYNPGSDTWVPIPGAPVVALEQTAVWTGTEMIVWGGLDSGTVNTGARFAPGSGTWSQTTTAGASGVPSPRHGHSAVWTGTEMIIWGGEAIAANNSTTPLADGARYNPLTDSWTPVSMVGAPAARVLHTAVWTGQDMIIWGGTTAFILGTPTRDGARYNPATDKWSSISPMPATFPGVSQQATVWTGTEILFWLDGAFFQHQPPGARYKPATDTWHAITSENNTTRRSGSTAVWTGTEMIVWGGLTSPSVELLPLTPLQTGGRYTP